MKHFKEYFKKFICALVLTGLFAFMLFAFLPAEILYANTNELPFVFGEYGYYLIEVGLISVVILSVLLALLPGSILRWILAVIFSIDLGAYVQNMFLNKGLDLMGANPDGYIPSNSEKITNLLIWILILIITIVVEILSKKKPAIVYLAVFLFAIQILAYVSIFVKADDGFYRYPETEYHLSGYEQYTVSSKGNIILFIVDCFSDRDLKNALAVKPEAIDEFSDFVFYTNDDACYFGTFPSLNHILTNNPYDFDQKVNDWTRQIWNSDKCNYFYDNMKELGYERNLYTSEISILCGSNPCEDLLKGKWDNLTNEPLERDTDKDAIRKLMLKMSAYRLAPKLLKNRFYPALSEYTDTVRVVNDPIMFENYDYFDGFKEKGLSVKDDSKMFIVQHIMGTHVFENDEFGNYKEGAGYEETTLGCMYVLKSYLAELKRLGVYDESTIIITADHGWEYGQQPVFFIKEEYRESNELEENDAPISHKELLPTIAELAGMDSSVIGDTIYDYQPGQKRERTLYFRDYREEYPDVLYYDGSKNGTSNVYVGYTYTGDEDDLLNYIFDKPSCVVPIADSYH